MTAYQNLKLRFIAESRWNIWLCKKEYDEIKNPVKYKVY